MRASAFLATVASAVSEGKNALECYGIQFKVNKTSTKHEKLYLFSSTKYLAMVLPVHGHT